MATGRSTALAEPPTRCVGVDPNPIIVHTFRAPTKVITETSDDFFLKYNLRKEIGDQTVEFAFIDGLHHFEAAIKDFINLERYSSKDTVVLVHDCIPLDKATSARERITTFWSGDTWKIIPCLKNYRPDLNIITIPLPPTGLAAIVGLDPESTVLRENLESTIDEYMDLDYGYLEHNKHEHLNVIAGTWPAIRIAESLKCESIIFWINVITEGE